MENFSGERVPCLRCGYFSCHNSCMDPRWDDFGDPTMPLQQQQQQLQQNISAAAAIEAVPLDYSRLTLQQTDGATSFVFSQDPLMTSTASPSSPPPLLLPQHAEKRKPLSNINPDLVREIAEMNSGAAAGGGEIKVEEFNNDDDDDIVDDDDIFNQDSFFADLFKLPEGCVLLDLPKYAVGIEDVKLEEEEEEEVTAAPAVSPLPTVQQQQQQQQQQAATKSHGRGWPAGKKLWISVDENDDDEEDIVEKETAEEEENVLAAETAKEKHERMEREKDVVSFVEIPVENASREIYEGTLCCPVRNCLFDCAKIGEMIGHLSDHEPKRTVYKCEWQMCGHSSFNKSSIISHFRRHSKISSQCKECEFWGGKLGELEKHMMKVHGYPRTFVCQKCRSIFKSSFGLKHHHKTSHGPTSKI